MRRGARQPVRWHGRSAATLWWERTALQHTINEAATRWPLETGGMLLGWRASTDEVVVTTVIGPGANAEHNLTSFRPDAAWQQEQIEKVYSRTERRVTYLGDWHSHPGGSLTLSPRDVKTLRRIARHPEARAAAPVMVVLAGGSADWHVGPYQLRSAWVLHQQAMHLEIFEI